MFKQVTDYKSACKVLGIKPIDKRRKLEEHIVVYIQLCTITQAINFIANGNKLWIPEYKQKEHTKTWNIWWHVNDNNFSVGLYSCYSFDAFGQFASDNSAHLRFINENAAEYAAKTFKPLYMKHIFGIE